MILRIAEARGAAGVVVPGPMEVAWLALSPGTVTSCGGQGEYRGMTGG